MLGAAGAGVAHGAPAPPAPAPGYYDFRLATRTFDSPLFDTRTSGLLRFFGGQSFPGVGDFRAWVSTGFPDQAPFFGIGGQAIPAGPFALAFDAGDFMLGSPQPPGPRLPLSDRYALRGVGVDLERGPLTWGVFAGRARNTLVLPGFDETRPTLFGGHAHTTWKRNFVGGGITLVKDATFADPTRADDRAVVFSGRLVRPLLPRLWVYSELFATDDVDLGLRVGVSHGFRTGEVAASFYSFADAFPIVYPLYRPGERGFDVRGRYETSEFTQLHGNVRWVTDDAVRGRRELRGSLAFDLNLGSNRPSIGVSYARDDLLDALLTTERISSVADRFAIYVNRFSSYGFLSGTFEHIFLSETAGLDRSQGIFAFRRAVGLRTTLDGSAVIQRDEAHNFGVTAESAVERPIKGPWSWLAGLGAAYVRRGEPVGEGIVRVGGSRRIGNRGWFARLELRIPFSIGLARANLNQQIVALDVGNRFDWSSFRELREALPGKAGPRGVVEGTVSHADAGLSGVTVLIDGQPRGATDGQGFFRIRGVATGSHRVSLDLRTLEPGFEPVGNAMREVEVEKKAPSSVAFTLDRFSSLQGAIVTCAGGKRTGLANADVVLRGDGMERSARTTHLGGFQFSRIPPGVYGLTVIRVDTEELLIADPIRIDLGRDIFGYVIELDCE